MPTFTAPASRPPPPARPPPGRPRTSRARARRGSRSSSRPPLRRRRDLACAPAAGGELRATGSEADALLFGVQSQVDDLRQVERDLGVLRVEHVPAVAGR